MYLIKTPDIYDPKLNLAIEEYVVRNLDLHDDLLYIYRNKPSVIIGKNQNPCEEVNLRFIETENIQIFRRISGGGTVYHEPGNINFCYITQNTKENFNNYKNFLKPIVQLLKNLEIPAKINPRNDIVIDGLKISGNAQFTTRGKMFSHGTLLYNADLDKVNESLRVLKIGINSNSTKSVRSKITNISEYLKKHISIESFMQQLIQSVLTSFLHNGNLEFDIAQWSEIHKLAEEKYNSMNWNWGRTPKFTIDITNPFNKKTIPVQIIDGRILSGNIESGDIFSELLVALNNIWYQKHEIFTVIDSFSGIDKSDKKLVLNSIFPFS